MTTPKRYPFDLYVAYRAFKNPGNKADYLAPEEYRGDKTLVARSAWQSFIASLEGLNTYILVILEGPDEWEQFYTNVSFNGVVEVRRCIGQTNETTFRRQARACQLQSDAEIVAFVEDDYLWRPGACAEIVRFMRSSGVEFVTPYDHGEHFYKRHHIIRSELFDCDRLPFYRTVARTTCTFFATREAVWKHRRAFEAYRDFPPLRRPFTFSDVSLWTIITKHKAFNPAEFLHALFFERYVAWSRFIAWLTCPLQLLFVKRSRLCVPVPSLASHLNKEDMPPGVDWHAMIRESIRKINCQDRVAREAPEKTAP